MYNAIESGVAALGDMGLKDRIASLKDIRDQATADADRIQVTLDSSGNQAITADMIDTLANAARSSLRVEGGGYRRDHLRAFAQRVEVADDEVRIMGSKSELLQSLVAASGGETAAFAVRSSVLKWRAMAALKAWRVESGAPSGAIFCRVHAARTREGAMVWTVGATLSAQSVTLIYRAMLDQAHARGLLGNIATADLADWRRALTAHSTRVGLTQDLFAAGADLVGIMQALRWKSPAQPARYAQDLAVEANAAARVVAKL